MNSERITAIWTAIALRGQREGQAISPQQACATCVEELGVTGAALVLTTDTPMITEPVFVTDSCVAAIEELQTALGEGPVFDAKVHSAPVIAHDLAEPNAARRWPHFSRRAVERGIRSVCSLPLAMGAIRVGCLNLYADSPMEFSSEQLGDAVIYADTALLLVLDARCGIVTSSGSGTVHGSPAMLWHAELHQAAGMVSVQLGVSVLDALVRIRAYAYSHERQLTDVARAVVHRQLRFAEEIGS